MAIYKKLDLWSITEGPDRMIDYDCNGNEKDSPYWDFYSGQIREMAFLAADMHEELGWLKDRLWMELPWKKIEFCGEDECGQTAISWFNTAACMLSDTDMAVLLENENNYGRDADKEKRKRINALRRLTKDQQIFLYTEVTGFITRYLELEAAFETITAVINELDYHQSFVVTNDGVVASDAAYL